jgi:hypothetical protein
MSIDFQWNQLNVAKAGNNCTGVTCPREQGLSHLSNLNGFMNRRQPAPFPKTFHAIEPFPTNRIPLFVNAGRGRD